MGLQHCLGDCSHFSSTYQPLAVMPGPWLEPRLDDEFFKAVVFNVGELWEIRVYDDEGHGQGTVVVSVTKGLKVAREGAWIQASYVAASDQFYRWWMSEGEGARLRARGVYHICGTDAVTCTAVRAREKPIHTDRLRSLALGDLTSPAVPWLSSPEPKAEVAAFLSARQAEADPVTRGDRDGLPAIEWPVDGVGDAEPSSGSASSDSESEEGVVLKEKLRILQKELDGRAKKKSKQKAKKEKQKKKVDGVDRGRSPEKREGRHKDRRRSEGREEREPKEKGHGAKRHKPGRRALFAPATEASDSGRDEPKSSRAAKEDHGPFGAGPGVRFCEAESDGESDSLFREAPSSTTKQMKLVRYAQARPGRLASRLLLKMHEAVSQEGGAESAAGGVKTPASAKPYFLGIMMTNLRDRMNLRSQRELRTLALLLDLLARGKAAAHAADLAAQRVKALEKPIQDGSWARARSIWNCCHRRTQA